MVCLVLISDKDLLYVCVSWYGLSVVYLFVWFVSFVRLFDFVRVFVLVSRVWGVCLFVWSWFHVSFLILVFFVCLFVFAFGLFVCCFVCLSSLCSSERSGPRASGVV